MAERQIVRSVVNIPPSLPYAGVVPFVVEFPVADSHAVGRAHLLGLHQRARHPALNHLAAAPPLDVARVALDAAVQSCCWSRSRLAARRGYLDQRQPFPNIPGCTEVVSVFRTTG